MQAAATSQTDKPALACRVERVPDNINDHPKQLQAQQAKQQDHHAQNEREQAYPRGTARQAPAGGARVRPSNTDSHYVVRKAVQPFSEFTSMWRSGFHFKPSIIPRRQNHATRSLKEVRNSLRIPARVPEQLLRAWRVVKGGNRVFYWEIANRRSWHGSCLRPSKIKCVPRCKSAPRIPKQSQL